MRTLGLFAITMLLVGCGADDEGLFSTTNLGGAAGQGGSHNEGGSAGTSTGGSSGSNLGGSAGTQNKGGTAGVGGYVECNAGEKRCNSGLPELCDNNVWVAQPPCGGDNPICYNGNCVQCYDATNCPASTNSCVVSTCLSNNTCGVEPLVEGTPCNNGVCNGAGQCFTCAPGAKKCDAKNLMACDTNGQWVLADTCQYSCSDILLTCTGVCNPGEKSCSGNKLSTCGNDGQWGASVDCAGDTAVCENGACRLAATCKELRAANNKVTGKHAIDPNKNNSPINVWCDMVFDFGGWTMFYSTNQYNTCATEGYVEPYSVTYMTPSLVQLLAQTASQIHIRNAGKPSTRSVTSSPNTSPILNLRNLDILNISPTFHLNDWSGPMASQAFLGNNNTVVGSYPDIWWANDNPTGLELGTSANGGLCVGYWDGNASPEAFEVYMR